MIRPDAPPDGQAALARAQDDYETLRRYVLEGSRGDRELGFALLIRRGMAAWIRAWTVCPVPPRAVGGSARGAAIAVPEGVRGEITRLLVTMALDAHREETHR